MKFKALLTWREALVRHFSSQDYIREYAGPNAGEGVNAQQSSTGNSAPDYWCASAVYRAVRKMLGKVLVRSGSCEDHRQQAITAGSLRTFDEFKAIVAAKGVDAVLGWQFFCVSLIDGKKHAHHTGLVGYVAPDDSLVGAFPDGSFCTTEGNAADPKKPASRDGNGLYTGRLRGNGSTRSWNGREYSADHTLYEFNDLEAL